MGNANTSKTGSSKLVNDDVRAVAIKIPSGEYRTLNSYAEKMETTVSGLAKSALSRLASFLRRRMNVDVRGFYEFVEFKDSYGADVKVKESSSAEGPHCWIFVEGGGITGNKGSAHLNVEQAEKVRDALDLFLLKLR